MPHQPTWQTPVSPGLQGLHGAANLLKGIAAGIPASNLSTASWPPTQMSQPILQQQHQETPMYQSTQPMTTQFYIQAQPAPAPNDQQPAPAPYTMTIQASSPHAMPAPFAMTIPAPAVYGMPTAFTMSNGTQAYYFNGTMPNGAPADSQHQQHEQQQNEQQHHEQQQNEHQQHEHQQHDQQQQQQILGPIPPGATTIIMAPAPSIQMATTSNGQTYYWMQPAAPMAVQHSQPQQGGPAPSQHAN